MGFYIGVKLVLLHRFAVFESRVWRRIFVSRKEEVTGGVGNFTAKSFMMWGPALLVLLC
jgi:hypothetical protein